MSVASMSKTAIASAFSRAAQSYDQFARVQHHCGLQLLALADNRQFRRVLDAGCGTGKFSQHWRRRGSEVTALDLSAAMLNVARQRQAARHFIQADIENLPLADGQFDLCWSNLAVQWCADLPRAISELHRVTAPGGWLLFSTLAQGSLAELHQAWRAVDCHLHVNSYPALHSIASASTLPGLRWHQRPVTDYYPDVLSAMRSVKGVGATCLQQKRQNQVLTRRQLQQLSQAWPRRYGQFPLTYQLVLGIWQHE